MSNPTTPFGWQMPENTDLVTDLPADFEVFGQAVATDLQYLLGGTTGQVLAKASATDLDFVWSADAAGMTNPMTTTGDSIYSSSGSTPARLGIGSAGQVLTVASGLPSWATPTSGGMTLLNPGGTALTGASVALTGIPGTYQDLRLVVRNFKPVTGSDHLSVYVNNDTNSRYNRWPVSDPSTNGNTSQSWAESSWAYVSPPGETTLFQGTAIFDIFDYANTTTWKLGEMYAINNNVATPANVNFMQQLIYYNQVTAISSIYLKTTGGDFSSGTAFLYGVK